MNVYTRPHSAPENLQHIPAAVQHDNTTLLGKKCTLLFLHNFVNNISQMAKMQGGMKNCMLSNTSLYLRNNTR